MLQKATLIEQYEDKFEQVRLVVHEKEVAVSDLRSQIANLTSKIETQQAQIQSYQAKLLVAEDQIRTLKAEQVERLQDKEQDMAARYEKQLAMVTQQMREKEKRLEVIHFEHQEEMALQQEAKEKEINLVQLQLSQSY